MRISSPVLVALFLAVLAGGSVAGCAAGAGDGSASRPSQSPAQSSEQPSEQPGGSVSTSPLPGSGRPPSGRPFGPSNPPSKYSEGEMTLTGLPEEGVEAGCTVMRSGDKVYLLLGGDRALLQSGRTVIVRGRPSPGLLTTCQQGIPFNVTEVRLA
jgi:hypothetical protein